MHDKSFVFYSGTNAVTGNQRDLVIERVKNYIEAEIAYKTLLAERLLNSSANESWEILIAKTTDLYEKPLHLGAKLKNSEMVKTARKARIGRIIEDIKDCNRLKDSVMEDNIDCLYLNIYFQYQLNLIDIENSVTQKNRTTFLESSCRKSDVENLLKKISQDVNTKNITSLIRAGIHLKKEMLNILQTEISPSCLRFLNDVKVAWILNCYALEISSEANFRFDNFNIRLNTTLPNHESNTLKTKYNRAIDSLSSESVIYGHTTLNDNYLKIFEHMKKVYQLEDNINLFLCRLEKHKQETQPTPTCSDNRGWQG